MNECENILTGLIKLGASTDQMKAGIIIGSRARTEHPADEYSDIDVVLLVDDIELFIQSDEWLNRLGKFHVSFNEYTVANGKERRVIFDNAFDADFIFLQANDIDRIEKDNDLKAIISRSYRILFDKIGFDGVLRRMVLPTGSYLPPSESIFINIVNNFWFHTIWAAKKLLRGELWVAKNCVDNYMKDILLKIIELYSYTVNGPTYDTWHCGRFIEQWAEPWVVEKFQNIYARYGANEILQALFETSDLFRKLAIKAAEKLNYAYPYNADEYATNFLESIKQPK
jgi:aminoglycoside 6-adenylyltransferase